MARPGVMFYFDIRPCIRRLSLEDKGQLFEAILDYAENGIEPELDGVLGVAWDFIQPRIDLDSEQYELKVETSQYAAFSRERKKLGLEPIDRDGWRSMTDTERHRAISSDKGDTPETSGDIGRYPNTTSNSNIFSSELGAADLDKPESKERAKSSFRRTQMHILQPAVSATRLLRDCRRQRHRAKSSCKHGQTRLTSAIGWTGIAGTRLNKFFCSRSQISSGSKIFCPGKSSESNIHRCWRGWEADSRWIHHSWSIP